MKWLDDIKNQIPMEQLQTLIAQIKTNITAKQGVKDDPILQEVNTILKHMHYLLSEKSTFDLGKQEIFKRTITDDAGKLLTCTYIVDFNNTDQVKRLKTVLLELADLSSPDSVKAKKEAIPGYLDYIAEASA